MVVEKQLAGEGQSRRGLGRDEFEKRVWQWQEQYGGSILQQLRRLGASCDWSRERFTLDPSLSGKAFSIFWLDKMQNSAMRRLLPSMPSALISPLWGMREQQKAKVLSRLGSNQRPHG